MYHVPQSCYIFNLHSNNESMIVWRTDILIQHYPPCSVIEPGAATAHLSLSATLVLLSPSMASSDTSTPSPFAYILSFLIVGLCWGFTTPFIRRAALTYSTPTHASITDPRRSWLTRQLAKAFFAVVGLLKRPAYAIPLLCNLTGSVWFFLLVGKAGEALFYRCLLSCFVNTGIRSLRQVTTSVSVLERALSTFDFRASFSQSCLNQVSRLVLTIPNGALCSPASLLPRALPYRTNHKFAGLPIHSLG
jgi:Putative transmembrane family 234